MKETELFSVIVDLASTRKAIGNKESRLFKDCRKLDAKLNYTQLNYNNKENYLIAN
ncbi:MAG: hypothetical protein RAP70_03845 [Candidatus Celaenobacter antarcticus]|nr:hypothetical protein [Candidatus Celaenobacter antarcticus]